MGIINREKLKHSIPNLFFSIPSLLASYYMIATWTKLDTWEAVMIAFFIYLLDVRQAAIDDYLEDRIKKLEDAKK